MNEESTGSARRAVPPGSPTGSPTGSPHAVTGLARGGFGGNGPEGRRTADLVGVTNLVGPAGRPAVGTLERLVGVARFVPVAPGDRDACYEGTTEIHWNGQKTELGSNGGVLLVDADGHEWEAQSEADPTAARGDGACETSC